MACLLNSESRRLYSWWWDSHISPKSSKWLQENLKDMDTKVKSMIKLIEEDADSFARRAEMYYKKRPELMKLVEEFYRAYRALAERYDYATNELRHAQRTLSAAFPNQTPFELTEDSSSSVNIDPDDPQKNGLFGLQMFLENMKKGEFHDPDKDEGEIENLKKALADMIAKKESLLVQYEKSLENFNKVDEELKRALEESKTLDEKARKAENEVCNLKEDLSLLRAEKDAELIKENEFRKTISGLESENDSGRIEYEKCLDRILILERKIVVTEESAKMFSEQASRARSEVEKLKRDVSVLNEEKEALRVLYAQCLEKICKLELDLSSAQDDVRCLEKKLKSAEEICVRLEVSNQSLKLEAGDLANKIMLKDRELCEKHEELEKLQKCVKTEHMHYVQVEAALETLQTLYTRSQEDQRALALELKTGLQMLKDLEILKTGLEEEIQEIKNENTSLKNTEVEIVGLREMKERLEDEVAVQMGQSIAMQKEIFGLKEEITELGSSYRALMSQLESVGLNPESIGSSINELRDENLRLKQIYDKDRGYDNGLSRKIDNIKQLLENNTALESSLFDVNCELEGSRNKVEELRNSCELLRGEKSALVLEKTLLLSQLHIITVNMQKLIDQSGVLENSLSSANVELERLREKSTGLEEICRVLNIEKSNLVAERSMLALQLENVQKRLEILETRFTQFEERYGGLENEKESGRSQVRELIVSLSIEKQERDHFMITNQTRLDDLENNINHLHEESKSRKEEFQEELNKAVIAQFENFILHKFIEDVEEKNYSLLVDREKHFEASKLADKLISELETEILEQQVEEELLLVEVENLRLGIYQVFLALEIGAKGGFKDGYETAQISVEDIVSNIKDMKHSILKNDDDKHRLTVENNIVVTLLRQLELEARESDLHKTTLINEYELMKDDFLRAKKEKTELVEANRQLIAEVNNAENQANGLESEVNGLHATRGELERAYFELQQEYNRALDENQALSRDFLSLKEENNDIILESLSLGNVSTVFQSLSAEKATEVKLLSEDLKSLRKFNNDLENEVILLREKLNVTQMENSVVKRTMEQLESKLKTTENINSELGFVMEGMVKKCEESEVKVDDLEKETVKLSNDNLNMKNEIEMLNQELEGRKNIQENLTLELQERENEFELWEAEATSFYFDLQISNTRDILFENKVYELTGVCESLEGETVSKDLEIEEMKQKASFMESEIEGLRAELSAYSPIIGSLNENIASLENNVFSMANIILCDNLKSKDIDLAIHPNHHHHTIDQDFIVTPKSLEPNGIFDLLNFQTRITTLEKIIVEDINRLAKHEILYINTKPRSTKPETEESYPHRDQKQNKEEKSRKKHYLTIDNLNLTKTKPESSEPRKGILVRDIPLDQASDGSSSTNSRRSRSRKGYLRTDDLMIEQSQNSHENKPKRLPYEPQIDELDIIVSTQDGKNTKFLQKLNSDAQKLANLEATVKDLSKRLETSRKSKKTKGVDFETVKEQLDEAEETISQLVNVNVESVSTIEKNPSLSGWVEQDDAWKGSEKIKRVQLEVQKIQYVLLKFDDEKKSKGKSRFSRTKNRTSVILRDFIHRGGKSGVRRRRLCGCFNPSSTLSMKGDRVRM